MHSPLALRMRVYATVVICRLHVLYTSSAFSQYSLPHEMVGAKVVVLGSVPHGGIDFFQFFFSFLLFFHCSYTGVSKPMFVSSLHFHSSNTFESFYFIQQCLGD